jgi:hypothetical protein
MAGCDSSQNVKTTAVAQRWQCMYNNTNPSNDGGGRTIKGGFFHGIEGQ